MNDKEKEEFDKWFKDFCSVRHTKHDCFSGWQAACEYKNKEYSDIADARMQTSLNNVKLEAENAKLIESLKFTTSAAEYLFKPDVNLEKGMNPTFYFTLSYEGDLELIEETKRARKVLKELEKKYRKGSA